MAEGAVGRGGGGRLSCFQLGLEDCVDRRRPRGLRSARFVATQTSVTLAICYSTMTRNFARVRTRDVTDRTLCRNLRFSGCSALVSILRGRFRERLPTPLPRGLMPVLLSGGTIRTAFSGFNLASALTSSRRCNHLCARLANAVILLVRDGGLPAIELARRTDLGTL